MKMRPVVFLGTPHQGPPVSHFVSVAARVTGFLGSNTRLLLSLASHWEDLSDLDMRFVQCMKEKEGRRQKTEIVVFCEKRPARMLGWLSVGLVGAGVLIWKLSDILRLCPRIRPEVAMLPQLSSWTQTISD
jgi:hypothetical protein